MWSYNEEKGHVKGKKICKNTETYKEKSMLDNGNRINSKFRDILSLIVVSQPGRGRDGFSNFLKECDPITLELLASSSRIVKE